jgi:hypothetical protein
VAATHRVALADAVACPVGSRPPPFDISNVVTGTRRVSLALGAGLALLTIAIGLTLTRSPPLLAGTNSIPAATRVATTTRSAGACQANEVLPADTSAIRLSLEASLGPRVTVKALSGKRVLTHGERPAGWTGLGVTVPVKRVPQSTSGVKICFAFAVENELVSIFGQRTPATVAATYPEGTLPGRMRIEYLRPGRSSWWSLALSVSRRMGLGRAWAGTWIVLLVLALMVTAATLASWLVLRDLR